MSEKNEQQEEQQQVTSAKRREFILDGKVNEESVRKIAEAIIDINKYDREKIEENKSYVVKPFKLFINTYGGSLYDANMLIGLIETSETPIHTYCYGKAMSAGFYIFSAGHKRFATPLSTFMYHDASVGMHDTITGLKIDLEWYEKLRDQYDAYMVSVTNLPKHIMDKKKERKEDWYLTGEEAKGYGLVDELIPFRKRG